ncbi:MAG: hypothetical protein JXL97_15495 [Bacteroidales bacterium]|nr:hypothetical protein [Bacteroidales bacterium]
MILNLLKRVTNSLESKGIEYMLSGSIALNNYSIPRMTMDIDIVIELDEDKLPNFLSIFDQNYYINEKTVRYETLNTGMFNVIDFETGFKIDFIIRKNTEYRKHEFERRQKTKITDFNVWIVSPEDLIISKIEWIQKLQSDKQINDLINLLAINNIDKKYIKTWCQKLKLNTFNLV